MNEILFLIQVITLVATALLAARTSSEALFILISLQAVMANLLVLKQIHLFGLQVTGSDAFAVGSIFTLNLLQERFGKSESLKASWLCFASILFFALCAQIHLAYIPSPADQMQKHYAQLLNPSLRLFGASITAFLLAQQLDIRFYAFLKKTWPLWHFRTRSTISLIFSQFLDTFLFTILGLWGFADNLWHIFILSYLIKIFMIAAVWVLAR